MDEVNRNRLEESHLLYLGQGHATGAGIVETFLGIFPYY